MKLLEFYTGRGQGQMGRVGLGTCLLLCLQKTENVQIIKNVEVEEKMLSVGNPKLAPQPALATTADPNTLLYSLL